MIRDRIRTATAHIAAPVLAATGFRFGKEYRRGATAWHRAVYALVDTVGANNAAYAIRPSAAELAEDKRIAALISGIA